MHVSRGSAACDITNNSPYGILYLDFILLGNTRTITQSALQTLQDEMGKAMRDPYRVLHDIFSVILVQQWSVYLHVHA